MTAAAGPTSLYARRRLACERLAPPPAPPAALAWWLAIATACVAIILFSGAFLPDKFRLDARGIAELLEQRDLWDGVSFDSFINTARVWDIVLAVFPEKLFLVLYELVLVAFGARLLLLHGSSSFVAQALAGTWFVCSAVFLAQLSKEMIALPVAVWLCLARTPLARLTATLLLLGYAALFRPYWFICFFYFQAFLLAFRLRRAHWGLAALSLAVLALPVPFVAAEIAGQPPLTDARTFVNAPRTDAADARSSFPNPLENTGAVTDMGNAALAWVYLNLPVQLLAADTAHYAGFALFQIATLLFFVRGLRACAQDASGPRPSVNATTAVRCAAFVIAYSATQGIFEPDFGSFLRHQVTIMLPLLVVACYPRAQALQARSLHT